MIVKNCPSVIPAQGTFQLFSRRNLYRRNLSAGSRQCTKQPQIFSKTRRSGDTRRKDSAGTFAASIGAGIFWKVPQAGISPPFANFRSNHGDSCLRRNDGSVARPGIHDDYIGLRGFTLIEVMITVVLIAIVTGIVYASLSAVVDSTENARVAAEEMRLRQFLMRNIEWNISQMYPDWQPGASLRDPERAEDALARSEIIDNTSDSAFDDAGLIEASYWLEGIDDSGPGGPADRISFASTARLSGGGALPGVIKQVTYEIVDQSEADETLLYLEDDSRVLMLQCKEVPIFDLATLNEEAIDDFNSREDFLEEQEFETPGWSVPIASMDIQYFDGEDWIDEWDSVAEGRLPWAVHFRLNFARPEGEEEVGFDAIDDPDMSLIVALPGGAGLTEPPVEPVYRAEGGTLDLLFGPSDDEGASDGPAVR